ncbi:LysE family transporter [Gracilibacillus timonensis]|uniref:LysE family transporter n=1 Tax=Gracilibacillus timonensis TaxID=1816696 RepID=UPI00082695CF|nr:LysE family transporter [Gracilibacillus timonensis]
MDHLAAYMLMALMMSMLPGTDTVLVMKNTMAHGSKAGYYTTLGIASGLIFWTMIAVFGLAVVIARSVFLFHVIKYLGAAYLIYLGLRAFFTKSTFSMDSVPDHNKKSTHAYVKDSFFQGAVSNVLNPKTVLVYVTFMPQFIHVNGNTNQQLIILGFILTWIAAGWFFILVYFLDVMKKWFKKPVFQKFFQKCTGVLLMGFGVKMIV